jgi:hypothetical protein
MKQFVKKYEGEILLLLVNLSLALAFFIGYINK